MLAFLSCLSAQAQTPDGLAHSSPGIDVLLPFRELQFSQGEAIASAIGVFVATLVMCWILLRQVRRRRRAETKLKASEERSEFATSSAGIGLWHYDIRANRLWSSEHTRSMFGLAANSSLTTEGLIGKVHPEDRHVAIAAIRAATHGTIVDGLSEFRVLGPKGETQWLQARGHTYVDSKGRPLHISGIFQDITAFKQAQQEAKQLSQRVLSIQDEERERIAQELHDSTAQHLAAIGLNLIALRGSKRWRRKTLRTFGDIDRSLEEATKELRAITYLLHPPPLARDGLTATLRRYVDGFERRTGLYAAVKSHGDVEGIAEPLQQAILRIVQEALTNVHRHASASKATVHLRRVSDRLHLVIMDNGSSPDPETYTKQTKREPFPTGVGISGMTARVRHLGGDLDVRSGRHGTRVHAVLPISTGLAT